MAQKSKSPERPATEVQGGVVRTHQLIGPKHNHDRVLELDGTINVSQSKVKAWRHCRLQYHLKYIEMLKKKKVKRPFTFGTIVHNMLEAEAEGDDPFEILNAVELQKGDYFRREIEMYGEIIDDIRVIMTEYFLHWQNDSLVPIRKNKRSSEHEFRIELMNGLWFTGRIDGAVNARKMRWVKENKTFSREPGEDERWRSVQGAVYFRALEMMGWPAFDGLLWDYIRSKPPSVPEVLKSGQMSERKISTLPTKLIEFFGERGEKVPEKLMTEAKENRPNYFFRVYNPVKRPVVDMVFNEFVETAIEIAENHGKSQVRNIGRHCSWCDYEGLCRAEMQGSDVDFIKSREYTVTEDESNAPEEDE